MAKVKWACPKCGSSPDVHGKGGTSKCQYTDGQPGHCYGFVCECDGDADHGNTVDDPCTTANCYHCGWGGTFPVPDFKLTGWAKKAWDAGWRPPKGWTP